MRPLLVVPFALLAVMRAGAQELADPHERILVPFVTSLAGGYGSAWSVALWIRNDGDSAAGIFPLVRGCTSPSRCPTPIPVRELGARSTAAYQSFSTTLPVPYRIPVTDTRAGALLYVDRDKASALRFALHVRDLSRGASNLGAAIPVVRERDFQSGVTSVMYIPAFPGYRYTLRIYALDIDRASVTVRLFDFIPTIEVKLAEDVVTLQRFATTATCSGAGCPWPDLPYTPAYGEVPLDLAALPHYGDIRVELEPQTPGLRYWAMVSATNNDTQLVTVYTP